MAEMVRVEVRRGAGALARAFVGEGAAAVDVTGPITRAIAHALWQARGGEAAENWADAEGVVEQLLALRTARATEVKPLPPPMPARSAAKKKSRR
jgi:hypothetical protein